MQNRLVARVNPYRVARETVGLDDHQADRFVDAVRLACVKHPKPAALSQLRRWLADYPPLWRGVFDMAAVVQSNLIERVVADEAARIALNKNTASIRQELGYDTAPPLERLLIENVVIAWLRYQWAEYQMIALMENGDVRIAAVEFWERRLSAAQHRYLSACQALANLRRLASQHPALQVNIAAHNGQQINVAGNLTKRKSLGQE